MNTPDPPQFQQLANLRPSHDGKRIAFTIECRDAAGEIQSGEISCAVEQLEDIIAFLAQGAVHASENLDSLAPPPTTGERLEGNPIPALGMGFSPGRSPEETFLVVQLSGFRLMFSVPSSGLAQLAPGLGRIGLLLSATSAKPQ